MIITLLIGVFSSLILYYIYEVNSTRRMKKVMSNVPGPTAYPLVGASFQLGKNSSELMKSLQRLVEEYGPVTQVWLGPTVYVIIADSKDIEAILTSTTHLNKPQVYDFLKKWLGTGLLSAPALKWKTQRKILTPAFHFKILETYISIFNANAKIMTEVLEKELTQDKFDITHYVDKCTLDIICETAMATRINAQLNEESQFTKSLKLISNAVLERAFKPWLFPDFTYNMSSVGKDFNESLEYINNYVDKVISQKKAGLAESVNTKPNDDDSYEYYGTKKRLVFLDLLLMYANDPAVLLTDRDIRDEVNTFMFAGHDTTASTTGFAIYLLASHPEIQERVVQEVKSVLGDREPTYQALLDLKYLDQVIKETLRLYPAVPYIGRKLYEDVKLPSGYTLPAGAAVTLFFFKQHRDPKVFPDPEKFNPDNFSPERTVGRFPFAYTPFSAGPRNCIGQKFALLEMKSVLTKLLQTYKITAMPPEPLLASELVLRSGTGINVRLEKRK